MTKVGRGGKRKNAGRKKLYDDPVNISFIVEKEDRDNVLGNLKKSELNEMFSIWFKAKKTNNHESN